MIVTPLFTARVTPSLENLHEFWRMDHITRRKWESKYIWNCIIWNIIEVINLKEKT